MMPHDSRSSHRLSLPLNTIKFTLRIISCIILIMHVIWQLCKPSFDSFLASSVFKCANPQVHGFSAGFTQLFIDHYRRSNELGDSPLRLAVAYVVPTFLRPSEDVAGVNHEEMHHFITNVIYSKIVTGMCCTMIFGNSYYAWMAYRMMKKVKHTNVCTLPYGILAKGCPSPLTC